MSKKWIIILSVTILILIGLALVGPIMSRVEQPKYTVVLSEGNIEVRQYQPMTIAKVQVRGERKEAINKGFRLLADYIFGNNTLKEKTAMTAPVMQQEGESIAMTAPVKQQRTGNTWTVSFVMPSSLSLKTLPVPNNDAITLTHVPAKKYVVIQFSGLSSNDNLTKHEKSLKNYITKNNLETMLKPLFAFYNPPWTLPFLRRNEIMIELK